MLPWILLAVSCLVNVVVIVYGRSAILEGKNAVYEAAIERQTYRKFMEKATMKFGEKKVGRVARDVLRDTQERVKAAGQGVV